MKRIQRLAMWAKPIRIRPLFPQLADGKRPRMCHLLKDSFPEYLSDNCPVSFEQCGAK